MTWRTPLPSRWPAERQAGAVWAAALVAYVVAVWHRTSFGVAAVEAVDRLGVSATVLSSLVVVQLALYAGMQVPMGMLLDRFGSRVLIAGGATLMAGGQLLLGLADDVAWAYLARALIGTGDAATFISVIRLVALWFPARRVPVLTQVTGLVGQTGQVLSAVPLVAVLHGAGWTPAFVGLGAVGALAAALAWLVVRDAPSATRPERSAGGIVGPLRETVRVPGTWLGFWTHGVTSFSLTVFVLLWGFPFLTEAQRLSEAQAGGLLSLTALAAALSGPVIGVLTGRHPMRRSWMVLAVAVAVAAVWTAVLVRDEPSPLWLLVVFVVVLGVGGPASAIGFDYARTANRPGVLGTATGLVNVGGFGTAVLCVLAVGVVLDVVGGGRGADLSLQGFRAAFAVLAVPWLVAVVGVLASRRATRRRMAEEGVVVPPLRVSVRRRRTVR